MAATLESGTIDLPAVMAGIEGSLIDQALRQTAGNKTRAAELSGSEQDDPARQAQAARLTAARGEVRQHQLGGS